MVRSKNIGQREVSLILEQACKQDIMRKTKTLNKKLPAHQHAGQFFLLSQTDNYSDLYSNGLSSQSFKS